MISHDRLTSYKRGKKLPSYIVEKQLRWKRLAARQSPASSENTMSRVTSATCGDARRHHVFAQTNKNTSRLDWYNGFFKKTSYRHILQMTDKSWAASKLSWWKKHTMGTRISQYSWLPGVVPYLLPVHFTFLFWKQPSRFSSDRTAVQSMFFPCSCTKQSVTGDIQHCTWTIPGL